MTQEQAQQRLASAGAAYQKEVNQIFSELSGSRSAATKNNADLDARLAAFRRKARIETRRTAGIAQKDAGDMITQESLYAIQKELGEKQVLLADRRAKLLKRAEEYKAAK